jgi:hypothetical protein
VFPSASLALGSCRPSPCSTACISCPHLGPTRASLLPGAPGHRTDRCARWVWAEVELERNVFHWDFRADRVKDILRRTAALSGGDVRPEASSSWCRWMRTVHCHVTASSTWSLTATISPGRRRSGRGACRETLGSLRTGSIGTTGRQAMDRVSVALVGCGGLCGSTPPESSARHQFAVVATADADAAAPRRSATRPAPDYATEERGPSAGDEGVDAVIIANGTTRTRHERGAPPARASTSCAKAHGPQRGRVPAGGRRAVREPACNSPWDTTGAWSPCSAR